MHLSSHAPWAGKVPHAYIADNQLAVVTDLKVKWENLQQRNGQRELETPALTTAPRDALLECWWGYRKDMVSLKLDGI